MQVMPSNHGQPLTITVKCEFERSAAEQTQFPATARYIFHPLFLIFLAYSFYLFVFRSSHGQFYTENRAILRLSSTVYILYTIHAGYGSHFARIFRRPIYDFKSDDFVVEQIPDLIFVFFYELIHVGKNI